MAKQSYGILDGYRGTVGPVIGYQWRGKWCLRARPRQVRNPQTEAQQEHRMRFRDMVQLAGRMKQALRPGLHMESLRGQMTECNLFVRLNKERFTSQGVDYKALEISRGPVAPVAFTEAVVDGDNVLRATFEKNPLRLRADANDQVMVYAFCPGRQEGRLSAPVYRRNKLVQMALPDEWAGLEVVFYAFVRDYRMETSETIRIDLSTTPQDTAVETQHAASTTSAMEPRHAAPLQEGTIDFNTANTDIQTVRLNE